MVSFGRQAGRVRRGAHLIAALVLTLTALVVAAEPATAAAVCGGQAATITGTAAGETLVGTAGPDVIVGLGGDDIIRGMGGDDIICGGIGADVIRGGAGDDLIFGQKGNDELRGELGKDILRGGNGNDLLLGGKGNDVLEGGNHRDRLVGFNGRDTLRGQNGVDELLGGAGNDKLRGGASADELDGGLATDDCQPGAGFGTSANCESYGSSPAAVMIIDFSFSPDPMAVTPGTTVRWSNDGSVNHTTTQDTQDPENRSWDSGSLPPGAQFAVTFDAAESYDYICSIHPFMTATVNVSN